MSADHRLPVDDRRPDPRDPHDVVPDDFMARFPSADTIREALAQAVAEVERERGASDDAPRCPACRNANIRRKRDDMRPQPSERPVDDASQVDLGGERIEAVQHRRPEAFKCLSCGAHFDEPLPPLCEVAGEQAGLDGGWGDE